MGWLIFLAIIIIIAVISHFVDKKKTSPQYSSRAIAGTAGGSSVFIKASPTIVKIDRDLPVPGIAINITIGSVVIDASNRFLEFVMTVHDVTSSSETLPVKCPIEDFSDQDGNFRFVHSTSIPGYHSGIRFSNNHLIDFPYALFSCPYKGNRVLEVRLNIINRGINRGSGTARFEMVQNQDGYIEVQERFLRHQDILVHLSLVTAAYDGTVDKSEYLQIRNYFKQRYKEFNTQIFKKNKENDLDRTLESILKNIVEGDKKPKLLLEEFVEKIASENDGKLSEIAYETCLKIVAADGVVDPAEEKLLSYIARNLGVEKKKIDELRDKTLSLSMIQNMDLEGVFIGLTADMSREEKVEKLNQEYRKWKARVNHKDPQKAAEASRRLDSIASLMAELEQKGVGAD